MKNQSNLQKISAEELIATRSEGQIMQMWRNVRDLHYTLEDIKAQMIRDGRLKIVRGKKVWIEKH